MKNQVFHIISALCEDIATPRSLAVKLLMDSGEWAQLQQLRAEPRFYSDAESYWKDAVVTDILRKCNLPSSVDREGAAVATFMSCEAQCKATNDYLSRFLNESLLIEDAIEERVYQFIIGWRKEIESIIGAIPASLTPRFSGGATFDDTGSLTTIPDKMSSRPTCYAATRDILPLWYETSWARTLCESRPWQSSPLTVRGNKFFTVPKDGTKFRGCCKEASINVGYQLDIGRLLKNRLLRIGFDLKDGQAVHRSLARGASITGHLATIDMSNASDTVCRNLVRLLLPNKWYTLLDSLRASHTKVKGKWYRLEKFSSMGNGFTFELETLIFGTLARQIVGLEGGSPDDVKCFGDDLIVPSAHFRSVMVALRRFGFDPNMKKTFGEGPFRESCGGDFWSGTPVRAHFIEELPDEPQQWISLANGIRRLANYDTHLPHRWAYVKRSWLRTLDAIPSTVRRCRGPVSLGDVVIHDDERYHSITGKPVPDGCEFKWYRAYVPVPNILGWEHWLPSVQLASCTLGVRSEGVSPRGDLTYRIKSVPHGPGVDWIPS